MECPYVKSEAGNIVVVKYQLSLLIKVDEKVYIVDDPESEPLAGKRKTVTIVDNMTISQIFEAIEK